MVKPPVARILFALIAATALCGRAVAQFGGEQSDAGPARTYAAPFDKVWETTLKALASVGLTVTDIDRSSSTISAERSVTAFSWGERVAVHVTKQGDDQTQVQVMSQAALAANLTAKNFEPHVLDRIAALLPGPAGRPLLSPNAVQAYEAFLDKPYPRAFVVSEDGRYNAVWGRKNTTPDLVAEEALQKCQQMGRTNCRVYAINGEVVFGK